MDPQQIRMLKKIDQGKAVLFIGAGASISGGCPSGPELAEMIKKEFSVASPNPQDFMDVCGAVLDTPGIDRHNLEDFIRKVLDVQPSKHHQSLCRHRWQAIFTTNFDDLIETAYRISPGRMQRCELIFGRDFSRRQDDYVEIVRLFKLMGSVTGKDAESSMVLSRRDYNRKLRQRGGLFKILYDFVKDGTIVYIGYSFRDGLARDLVDEVADEVGIDRLPWGWALLPDWDVATEQFLRQRKIIPLRLTFEQFLEALPSSSSTSPIATDSVPAVVTVAQIPVEISAVDQVMYNRQFEFLRDSDYADPSESQQQSQRAFLEGKGNPWRGIRNGWAFRRSLAEDLRSEIVKQLKKQQDREAPILLLTGPAGSGKTTTARIVAHDIYKNEGFPSIFLRPEQEQVDFLVIDSYVRHLTVATATASKNRVPLLIVVDDAATKRQDLRRLAQYMVSRGNPAVILAIARENEWEMAGNEHSVSLTRSITLPDDLALEEGEPRKLITHLRNLGVLISPHDDSYWEERISREYQNSFQTTLYFLAEPTRPPLLTSIISEYERLTQLAQQAYRYVSLFYQFGLPLDLELLARSLGRSYDDFIASVYDPASIGVIIDDVAVPQSVRFRARSRKIAELMVGHLYSDPTQWLSDLEAVLGSLLPQNANEVETLRTLLIRLSGRGESNALLAPQKLHPLYERAIAAGMRDSATLHHLALLLVEEEDFESAEKVLADAMKILDDPYELSHFKTASKQHVYNSMGMVAGRYGLSLEKMHREKEAASQFAKAEQYFRSARLGLFPNSYPYYSEAWMAYTRGRNSTGTARIELLARALQVLDESEGNVPEDEKASIQEMEAKVVQYLGSIPSLKETLEQMSSSANTAALYLQARLTGSQYASGYDINSAYAILISALEKSPNHVPCLRLATRFHRRLYPNDWEGRWKLLKHRYELEGTNGGCDLLFDLGLTAGELGRYGEAAKYFEELELLSLGHPMRSGIVALIRDGSEPRRFSGFVKSVHTRFEAWLRSDTIGQDVKCVPLKQKFTVTAGQSVTFSLAANYIGFLAIDLRPS